MQGTLNLRRQSNRKSWRFYLFWSICIHVVADPLLLVLTASYSGGIATIWTSLKSIFLFNTVLQGVIASFFLWWGMNLDKIDLQASHSYTAINMYSTTVGVFVYYVIHDRFSSIHIFDSSIPIFDQATSVVCSAITIFAYLVDNEKKGTFNIVLPTSCPNILNHLFKELKAEIKHWIKTSVFIGCLAIAVQRCLHLSPLNVPYLSYMSNDHKNSICFPYWFDNRYIGTLTGTNNDNSSSCNSIHITQLFTTIYISIIISFYIRVTPPSGRSRAASRWETRCRPCRFHRSATPPAHRP